MKIVESLIIIGLFVMRILVCFRVCTWLYINQFINNNLPISQIYPYLVFILVDLYISNIFLTHSTPQDKNKIEQ
jgi:hypothetical protein